MDSVKHFKRVGSAIARKADGNAVSDAIGRFYDAFAEILNTDLTLGDQASTSCRRWHTLFPQQKDALLSYAG